MDFELSELLKLHSIIHLATYPSRNVPTDSADEANIVSEKFQLAGGARMKSNVRLLCRQIDLLISSNPRVTLSELSHSIGMDRRRIEYALREKYGCSFREFKNRARLNHVMALLTEENTRISIKEVATTIGITPNALSRFIRSKTGNCAKELRSNKGIIRGISGTTALGCSKVEL
jgi:AraC-like DNA-binding protein